MYSIRAKIKMGYYEVKGRRPTRKRFEHKCGCNCPNCGTIEFDEKGYKVVMTKFKNDENRRLAEFKRDALDDVGLLEYKNANRIFEYAWQRSRSDGYNAVLNELEELSQLII